MRGPCSTPITPLTGSFFHADPHFWAWWVRKWADEGGTIARLQKPDFGTFQYDPQYGRRIIHISTTEEDIVAILKRLLVEQVGEENVVRVDLPRSNDN